MQLNTRIRSRALSGNHSAGLLRPPGLKVRSKIRAGALSGNHNVALAGTPGIKVRTRVKAGGISTVPGGPSNHAETLGRGRR